MVARRTALHAKLQPVHAAFRKCVGSHQTSGVGTISLRRRVCRPRVAVTSAFDVRLHYAVPLAFYVLDDTPYAYVFVVQLSTLVLQQYAHAAKKYLQ